MSAMFPSSRILWFWNSTMRMSFGLGDRHRGHLVVGHSQANSTGGGKICQDSQSGRAGHAPRMPLFMPENCGRRFQSSGGAQQAAATTRATSSGAKIDRRWRWIGSEESRSAARRFAGQARSERRMHSWRFAHPSDACKCPAERRTAPSTRIVSSFHSGPIECTGSEANSSPPLPTKSKTLVQKMT